MAKTPDPSPIVSSAPIGAKTVPMTAAERRRQDREGRQAEALRANLTRRKAAARRPDETAGDASK